MRRASGKPDSGDTLAVVRAKLWAMTASDTLENATVVIASGKIAAVGAGLAAPQGAPVIDAGGALVTPGLMSGATQLGLVEIGSVAEDGGDDAGPGPGGALDVQYGLNPSSALLPIARADGLTRAAVYPGRSDKALIAGAMAVLRLSEGADILDRSKVGLLVTIGDIGANAPGGPRAGQWGRLRRCLDAASPLDQRLSSADVRDHLEGEVLQEVLARRMPLAIQAGREADIRQAIDLGRDHGVRVIIVGGAEAWRAADLLAERAIPVVLNPYDNLPANLDAIGARRDNAAILQRAGVAIAFSPMGIHLSHNAGVALREVAGLAVAHGLPWLEALKAVTVNPAQIWGVADHYGTVAVGMDADLVIWDADPLEPSSAPTAVLVRGQPASLVTRQTLLRERYHPKHGKNAWSAAYR